MDAGEDVLDEHDRDEDGATDFPRDGPGSWTSTRCFIIISYPFKSDNLLLVLK